MKIRRGEPARANKSFSNAVPKNNIAFSSPSTSNGHGSSSSRVTFASSISACWNNSSLTTSSTPSTIPDTSTSSSSSSASQPQRTTTCLFCPNVVPLPTLGQRNAKLEKFIGNLCKHLKIQRSGLPEQCTKEMFPFCTQNCEPLVIKLWKQEGALRDILQDIDDTVNEIEHAVVDGEILGNRGKPPSSSSTARIEKLKVTKLKDMILTGYRKKLYRKLAPEGANTEEGDYDHENDNEDEGNVTENWGNGVEHNYDGSQNVPIEIQETELATVKREHVEQLGDVTISVVDTRVQNSVEVGNGYRQDEDHQLNLPPPLHEENENEMYSYEDEEQEYQHEYGGEEEQHWSVDPNVARTLVIANENDVTGVTSVIEIKQEAFAAATNDYEPEEDEVYTLQNRKRRFLYEGVEIYTASGTGRYSSMNYLQCSACSYTVPLPRHKSSLSSRYMIMKTHILHIHKNKTGVPKGQRQREHICVICSKKFLSRQQMREHKATHSPDEMVTCDICMKPMAGTNSVHNLLIHKFSHKNDEERRIAYANGERGSSAALLSGRIKYAKFPSPNPTPKSVQTNSAMRQVNQQTNAAMRQNNQPKKNRVRTEAYNPYVNEYSCEFCDRTFARKCHLARHRISQHLNQTAQPSSSSSSSPKSKNCRRRAMSSPVRQAPPSGLKAVLSSGRQSVGNLGQVGANQNLPEVRVAVPRASINVEEFNGIGRRVVVGNGTVVTLNQATLNRLIMST